jgi:Peptidase family M28
MHRRLLSLILAIALLLTACTPPSSPAPSSSTHPKTRSHQPSSPQPHPLSSPPILSPDRLFSHLTALSFVRYRLRDRQRARDYLTQQLSQFDWTVQPQTFPQGVNLIAERAGRDPAAGTILVVAHYDTVPDSPGADDNASAVATVLEIARLLRSRPTPRTLKLVFFDQEETGLLGSFAFAAQPDNLANLVGVINLEMVGYACTTPGCQKYPDGLPKELTQSGLRDRGDFVGVIGDQEHLPLLQAFQSASRPNLPPVLTVPIPLKGILTPDVLRSDHAAFWAKGIGAVMVGDTGNFRNPHYHQPSDTPETLDRAFFAGAAQLVLNATTALLENPD